MTIQRETYNESSASDIERYGKRLIGHSLKNILGIKDIPSKYFSIKQSKASKGVFGSLLEEYYYGIKPPNTSAPDFPKAGVELKSTPIKKLKRGELSSKERLVLGLINYKEEAKKN